MSKCYTVFSRANHLLAVLQPHLCRVVGKDGQCHNQSGGGGDKHGVDLKGH